MFFQMNKINLKRHLQLYKKNSLGLFSVISLRSTLSNKIKKRKFLFSKENIFKGVLLQKFDGFFLHYKKAKNKLKKSQKRTLFFSKRLYRKTEFLRLKINKHKAKFFEKHKFSLRHQVVTNRFNRISHLLAANHEIENLHVLEYKNKAYKISLCVSFY